MKTLLMYGAVGAVGVLLGRYWMHNQTIAATGNTVTLPEWIPFITNPVTPTSYTRADSTAVTASTGG